MQNKDGICVCGAGHQGLAMAAHLSLNGENIALWNRSKKNIETLIKTKVIQCNGLINGVGKLQYCSSNISDVIRDVVLVTTPSSAHKDIAHTLAPYVHKDMVIILNPGRTFGAIDFANCLNQAGVTELPHIAETQTIVYTCRKNSVNSAYIYALKQNVAIAALKDSNLNYIVNKIPECIRSNFKMVDSLGVTSFSNVGMILHCAPVLMNIGWIESNKVDFKYYYEGISPSVAGFLEKLDQERILVANRMGFKIESVKEWISRTYNVDGATLYECICNNSAYAEIDAPPSLKCRYIEEDVPNGLVPIEYLAKKLGIKTPYITMIIDLASSVLNCDFRVKGRCYDAKTLESYF